MVSRFSSSPSSSKSCSAALFCYPAVGLPPPLPPFPRLALPKAHGLRCGLGPGVHFPRLGVAFADLLALGDAELYDAAVRVDGEARELHDATVPRRCGSAHPEARGQRGVTTIKLGPSPTGIAPVRRLRSGQLRPIGESPLPKRLVNCLGLV